MQSLIQADDRQIATILAALRFWAREGLMSGGAEHDIATDGGKQQPLNAEEINELCETITLDEVIPAVVIECDNGSINCVRSSHAMDVVILDHDTEGGDESNIMEVNGNEFYVTHQELRQAAEPGFDGINPDYVENVLDQVTEADSGEPEEATTLSKCDECDDEVAEVIGTPSGAEICRACFNAGAH